jgi:hypothetical protein
VDHGLNVDAGIFVSYIGLFSYYNFDNWAYQPSYVSSNTPWFFNGLRIQWFPTDKLKIEPWIINGWQSYGRMGTKPGLGGQILWRPKPWLSLVFNNYGMGEDTLGNGNANIHRSRIHTDDSVEVKYYDRPQKFLDKAAFSLTGDLGCEYGGGVSCHGNGKGGPKQSFVGWMAYNRFWFKKDTYGLTVGGGMMNNPGRYLVLLPPINGADAVSGGTPSSLSIGCPDSTLLSAPSMAIATPTCRTLPERTGSRLRAEILVPPAYSAARIPAAPANWWEQPHWFRAARSCPRRRVSLVTQVRQVGARTCERTRPA